MSDEVKFDWKYYGVCVSIPITNNLSPQERLHDLLAKYQGEMDIIAMLTIAKARSERELREGIESNLFLGNPPHRPVQVAVGAEPHCESCSCFAAEIEQRERRETITRLMLFGRPRAVTEASVLDALLEEREEGR